MPHSIPCPHCGRTVHLSESDLRRIIARDRESAMRALGVEREAPERERFPVQPRLDDEGRVVWARK